MFQWELVLKFGRDSWEGVLRCFLLQVADLLRRDIYIVETINDILSEFKLEDLRSLAEN